MKVRSHNRVAADNFLARMKAARKALELFAESGFAGDELPIPGICRLIRNGYRIDYKIENGEILVAAISSSVNRPLDRPGDDEDFDYES